jgi:predicted deacetylase
MNITIRLDDVTPGMDRGKFIKFKKLLDDAGVKPLIGVVPDNRDSMLNIDCMLDIDSVEATFWDEVKSLRNDGWTIAMHGLHHVYSTRSGGLFPLNHLSEFAGRHYEDQARDIAEGRRILEEVHGISTDIFMAPAHSYDRNTLRALRQNKFSRITDGFGTDPYEYEEMTFYPISENRSSCLDKLSGWTTFVIHLNTMTDGEFKWYEELFAKSSTPAAGSRDGHTAIRSYSDFLMQPAAPRGFSGQAREYLLASAKRCVVGLKSAGKK